MMQRLREATRVEHADVERTLLASGFLDTRARYVAWLRRTLGFYVVVEDEVFAAVDLAAVLPDLEQRRKVPRLVADLRAQGDADPLEDLPRVPARPRVSGPGVLGCAYVLEGATLGGRILLRRAHESLGIDPSTGASFLAGYAEHTAARWRTFGAAVDDYASTRSDASDAIVAGARATFRRMEAWLAEL